jgi:ABC-2 type transport system ATP-binding protein
LGAETFPPPGKEVIKMKRKLSAVGGRERSPPTQGVIEYDADTVFKLRRIAMIISVENLVKKYNGHTALDGLNFSIEAGDIFGFLGPNGAGKTTTIRILTTMIKADSGNVLIDGHDIFREPLVVKRIINALPESNGYYEWMAASEYLKFFSNLYEEKASKEDIHKLLEVVGLQGKEGHLIRSFSHGMKQRLGIARALINSPKLLFLDEPTNGLDPQGRRDIHDLLIDLNQKHSTTIFLSTHLLDDVEILCNRIAIINYGKIIKIGEINKMKGQGTIEDIFFKSTKEGAL